MNGKKLVEALRAGQRIYGTLIVSPSPHWIKELQGIDLDCVFIDTEHIPLGTHELAWMCRAYGAIGFAPIVRITSPDPFQASKALDAGAVGIIAPYIETVEQVQALRGAVKLRPLKGRKLQEILSGQNQPEAELAGYLKQYNANNALIVNIESVPAVEALDDILKVPGLDAVLIGPHDLTCSLGIPEQYDHPEFDKVVRGIIKKARAANVGVGMHNCPSVDQEIAWMKAGLNLILRLSDIVFFKKGLIKDLNALRQGIGDAVSSEKLKHNPI
jgi:staphyloferrin B biosynthesis citrate synthase